MQHRALPAFLAVSWLLVTPASGYEVVAEGPRGSITGTVRYEGPPPERTVVDVSAHRAICSKTTKYADHVLVSRDGGLQDTVVYLKHIVRGKPFDESTLQILQTECEFRPFISLVPAGRAVTVVNEDRIFHCMHANRGANRGFNHPVPKIKPIRTLKFDKPDFVRLNCFAHSWMYGWVVVEDHPYYEVTDAAGRFTIRDVPTGRYRLVAWHESLGERSTDVVVRDGSVTGASFRFSQSE